MKVIVGLTTIFDRQKQCGRTLRSLLSQTTVPDEIWLFVSSKPHLLDKGIQPYCLEPSLYEITNSDKRIHVEWTENTGPYRKLLPLLKKYWQEENTVVITCDDDVFYTNRFIEEALRLYKEKKCCIGFMGTRIENTFQYELFKEAKGTQDLWNLPKGCGGILYSPAWFSNKEIFDWKDYPTCDDLWFAAWRIAAGVECYIAELSTMEQSFSFIVKGNLWTSYNERKNSDFLERILHFLVYKGWLKEAPFFSETSNLLFRWNTFVQSQLLPCLKEENLEGNIWSKNNSKVPDMTLLNKQKNIVWLAQQMEEGTMLEVGINAGFSAYLFLLSNPKLRLMGLDLGEHLYAHKCYEILKEECGDRIQVLFGDSRETMPKLSLDTYDCIHVDGGHSEAVAKSDIEHATKLVKRKGKILIDDTNLGDVQKAIQSVSCLKQESLPFLTSPYSHSLYSLSEVP